MTVCPADGLQVSEHREDHLFSKQSQGAVQECCLDTSSSLIPPSRTTMKLNTQQTKSERSSAPAGCDGDKALRQKLSKVTLAATGQQGRALEASDEHIS